MASSPALVPDPHTQAVLELEQQYLIQTYARFPVLLRRGKGCWLYDAAGRKYLDLISGIGVNALGHAHPRILRVLREQAALLVHCSNLYYHDYQGPLARRLATISGLQRCFFTNSGTEAIEGALKIARAHGRRQAPEKVQILALENSFHGRTLGALSITGQPKYRADFEPLLPGVRFIPRNDVGALERTVGPETAAIVLEWIQGEGGIYPLEPVFARRARELADQHNALLILDEIQCGLGRTGRHFAYQMADPPVLPDIAVVAKPLACGLPLGAIIANEKAAAALRSGMHGSTFGGGALACRVALEFLDILEELLPAIHQTGGQFRVQLTEMARHFGFVREVRGFGLMIGIELDFPCRNIVEEALAEGLLINCTHDKVIRLLPPYVISETEVDRAVKLLTRVLKKVKYPPESA
ncbi:MAG: aspartate aminotransferase family protein [Bryobacterales bacterium]|nr:aspartate aminotransferase family protein [Bryobacteraceae bacterium]MDW8131663.1 aspartate aminotransferase family protein [Bryobacterales bacterium]